MPITDDPDAPHGRDSAGVPLAPFGLTRDNKPRRSRRGAPAGSFGNRSSGTTTTAARKGAPTDADRKQMLCELSSMLLETPLAAASQVPQVARKIGQAQADALAGDAFILAQFMPQIADGAIFYSKTSPKALAWLDKVESGGPAVVVVAALLQMGKALLQNHLSPRADLAEAGRNLVGMRMAMMAASVNAQAAAFRAAAQPPADADVSRETSADEPTLVNDFAVA